MREVTAQEVLKAVNNKDIVRVSYRTCSLCKSMMYFEVINNELFLDTNCGCTTYSTQPSPRTWERAAEIINESDDEERKKLMLGFGIELED